MPLDFDYRVEIGPSGLVEDARAAHIVVQWYGVSELFYSRGYWVFLAQGQFYFVPERYFADAAAERAFLTEALSYMTEEARERSVDAATFAASGDES